MENFEEKVDEICLYYDTKFNLLQKYMYEWVEARSKVSAACFMDFEYNSFERWLDRRMKLYKAIQLYGSEVVSGNIGGMKFDVNIVDKI